MSITKPIFDFDITFSIVTYKTAETELRQCLESFIRCKLRVKTIVIDNSPTDELRKTVISLGAEYRCVGRNIGFGAAHNLAIRECIGSSRYHLVLNADVFFGLDVLEKLVSYLDRNPRIGAVMPRILYDDGSPQHLCKLLPTPWDLLLRRVPLGPISKWFQRRMDEFEFKHIDNTRPIKVPMISGCCMFLRTRVFQTVGMFDERYFMYQEDFDLCRRIHSAFDVVYFPQASVVHGYARGSYKVGILMWYHICSAIKYFSKWGWFIDPGREAINQAALSQNDLSDSRPYSELITDGESASPELAFDRDESACLQETPRSGTAN
jgi:GT2 family glycosyltransferase